MKGMKMKVQQVQPNLNLEAKKRRFIDSQYFATADFVDHGMGFFPHNPDRMHSRCWLLTAPANNELVFAAAQIILQN